MDTHSALPQSDSFFLLINDLIQRLDSLLVALNEHPHAKGAPMYLLYCAGHILRCSSGYSSLRKTGNDYSAKMLARPIIEALFRLHAVHRQPELLYRIAYSEYQEDMKFAQGLAKRTGRQSELIRLTEKWNDAERALFASTPPHHKTKKTLTTFDTAEIGELVPMYVLYYRLYCQYTHASLRAMQGSLDGDPDVDEFAISTALRMALEDCAQTFPFNVETQDLVDRHSKLTADTFKCDPAP